MRGVVYGPAERELLMKMHQQGKSLSVLSRETGIARPRRPNHSPRRLLRGIRSEILELRKRGWGPARIALALGIGHSSVHRVLVRHGCNRLRSPEKKIIRRYEKSRPGELVHLDLKYLYRWKNSQREYALLVWTIFLAKRSRRFGRNVAAATPRHSWSDSSASCPIGSKRL
jgi:hypothetical protein